MRRRHGLPVRAHGDRPEEAAHSHRKNTRKKATGVEEHEAEMLVLVAVAAAAAAAAAAVVVVAVCGGGSGDGDGHPLVGIIMLLVNLTCYQLLQVLYIQ